MSYRETTISPSALSKFEAVDKYVINHLLPDTPSLSSALAANAAANLESIDVAPPQGKFLHILAKLTQAKRVLEIGTLGGYSAIWLAQALPDDGKLITCELEPEHARVATSNIKNAGLEHKVEVRVGAALETLEKLDKDASGEGPQFDMFFIDADKKNNPAYFAWALGHSHSGSLIVVDNVVRQGRIVDKEKGDEPVEGTKRLFELMREEDAKGRVECTALQTVGLKGWDGLAMALVK